MPLVRLKTPLKDQVWGARPSDLFRKVVLLTISRHFPLSSFPLVKITLNLTSALPPALLLTPDLRCRSLSSALRHECRSFRCWGSSSMAAWTQVPLLPPRPFPNAAILYRGAGVRVRREGLLRKLLVFPPFTGSGTRRGLFHILGESASRISGSQVVVGVRVVFRRHWCQNHTTCVASIRGLVGGRSTHRLSMLASKPHLPLRCPDGLVV